MSIMVCINAFIAPYPPSPQNMRRGFLCIFAMAACIFLSECAGCITTWSLYGALPNTPPKEDRSRGPRGTIQCASLPEGIHSPRRHAGTGRTHPSAHASTLVPLPAPHNGSAPPGCAAAPPRRTARAACLRRAAARACRSQSGRETMRLMRVCFRPDPSRRAKKGNCVRLRPPGAVARAAHVAKRGFQIPLSNAVLLRGVFHP